MLPVLAGAMVAAGVFLAALAGYVSWRRGTSAGFSLAVLLLAVAWWGLAYAVELSMTDLAARIRWGDLKYIGVCALVPSWLVFVLQYTGRGHLVTRRLLLLLMIEPVALLLLLANGATHDLVRFYPPSAKGDALPVVATGPLFWAHLAYANLLILVATVVFVVSMVRLSRVYRRLAVALVAAALFPWVANLLHNLEVGWFTRIDLTPFAFIITGVVLVWGVYRERMVNLTPLARGVIVETMADPVFVLDAFGRITDTNPAGGRVLARPAASLVGRSLDALLPDRRARSLASHGPDRDSASLVLRVAGEERYFDAHRQPLADQGGVQAGELVVLRDITERVHGESRIRELLAERTRVASALQASLLPARLPEVPGLDLAGLYQPAGDGSEIGGDFFDVFPLGPERWGIVLGDVSGKGAEAAAVTALTRYTLRALADDAHPPSHTLRALNTRLLADIAETAGERFCTLVYAVATRSASGYTITMCLAGHHPPLLRRATGRTAVVGKLGTALGLVDDPELHDTEVEVHEGDLFCLYTDGLVEARLGTDLFGAERAAAVLQNQNGRTIDETVAELVAAVRRFHGVELADDLAVLGLRAVSGPQGVGQPGRG